MVDGWSGAQTAHATLGDRKVRGISQGKKRVLSRRTPGKEKETLHEIQKSFAGTTQFANDMDCFTP
jgi:hypothetical protein